jgi:hypothetical protein
LFPDASACRPKRTCGNLITWFWIAPVDSPPLAELPIQQEGPYPESGEDQSHGCERWAAAPWVTRQAEDHPRRERARPAQHADPQKRNAHPSPQRSGYPSDDSVDRWPIQRDLVTPGDPVKSKRSSDSRSTARQLVWFKRVTYRKLSHPLMP